MSDKRVSDMTDEEICALASDATLYTRFTGGWCDNCRIAAKTKDCPDCHEPMRPAEITVSPTDV